MDKDLLTPPPGTVSSVLLPHEPNNIDFRKAQVDARPSLANYYYTDEEQKKLKLGKYSNTHKGHL